ncbi:hypothetical protein E8L09_07980 [Streptococcus suis]|uniref:Bacterial toxin 44 domain-containing protein n=2 Tax=Streptococcus suis TaxID=1307 RepID=A0A4T2GSH7_STRSU|nr:hypothetical protein [Streptococcus suis]TII02349.1 hypothetical protein E8L09_07980 [Streptococcus suis]HEM6509190.1 hypothetical protein [Streptococcus suis]
MKDAEKLLSEKLQKSGIDMQVILRRMGDDLLAINTNAGYNHFIAGSKIVANIQDNYQFYNLVNTGQPLDLKNRAYQSTADSGYSIWSRDWGNGIKEDYAGNYLYGYVGTGYLKTSSDYLKSAAGTAQLFSDINKKGYKEAILKYAISKQMGFYGDNAWDSNMIQDGVDDYNEFNKK